MRPRCRAPLCLLVVLQLCPAQVPARGRECASGSYTAAGRCCAACPPGFGVAVPCGLADTQCEPCRENRTFSAVSSAAERCRPCQPGCAAGEVMLRACGPRSDTLCMEKDLPMLKRVEGQPGEAAAPGEGSAAPNASAAGADFGPPAPEDAGKNIIPVYCSILAAVVVGLLAYVAFKCWHTCKQKQQLAKARAGELGTAVPEGEKLHSDSGVFLDTHSLQEPHQLSKAPRPEGRLYGAVPAARREELERLLESGGDWRALAARLGYEDEAVGTFARGQAPARTLLATWAAAEGATVEALAQALAAIGRPDAAERLAAPADASSLV
ncbi:death domain-containing membrane protein NRADD-like [Struthio camelus]|uniref:death domain-containing membrane protein NRADD-like n=1 Tax=Struthio camelus TaxID=8801 RepID=UPI003603DD3C